MKMHVYASLSTLNNVSGKSHIIYGWDESESQKGI